MTRQAKNQDVTPAGRIEFGELEQHGRELLRAVALAATSIGVVLAATLSVAGGLALGARLDDRSDSSGNRSALRALSADSFPHGAIDRRAPFTVKGTR